MEDTLTLAEELEDLVSAEDFLEFFAIPYDPAIVQVNRLHILQRFHDYLGKQAPNLPPEEAQQRGIYRLWLERAYQDFVTSDSLTEKVFAVFQHVAVRMHDQAQLLPDHRRSRGRQDRPAGRTAPPRRAGRRGNPSAGDPRAGRQRRDRPALDRP